MSAQLKIPCLGRPFKLGMLYDCHTDKLIPGRTFWDSKILASALQTSAQTSSNFEVITDNTIEKKSLTIGLEGDLKLSFLSGLFEVNGAAKFMNDQQTSEHQSRVTLKYSCTTRFEQLTMEQLGTIQYQQMMDDHCATHVVTGVTYGSDAFFVFDRTVNKSESLKEVRNNMENQIKIIPVSGNGSLDIMEVSKIETEKIQCKFYGDVLLPSNPSTFEEAVKVYSELPQHLKLNCDADRSIPKVVYLSSLSGLDVKPEQKIIRSITCDLIAQVEIIMESFHHMVVLCNDLQNHDLCSKFLDIKNQISSILMLVNRFKMKFASKLYLLLPKIRSSQADLKELTELISSVECSPFNTKQIEKYLKGKGREIKMLTQYLENMNKEPAIKFLLPSSDCDLVTITANNKIEHVVCFVFNVTSDTSPYTEYLERYLRTEKTESISCKEWFESTDVSKELRSKLQSFSDFVAANPHSQTTAFVVTDRNEETDKSGPAIIIYDNGVLVDLALPGKPGTPHVNRILHDSVDLTWTEPGNADAVTYYKVLYRSSSSECSQLTTNAVARIDIDGLSPDTEYTFKVQANTKFGISVASDPINAKTDLSADILKLLTCIQVGSPYIYQLPMSLTYEDKIDGLFKYDIRIPRFEAYQRKPAKVLILVGATGAGKSTLINGMANYILGVNWKDNHRFKLIIDKLGNSHAYSQTKAITAYTFDYTDLPYSLVIVDTPGFGDSGGIERDKYIARQIKIFFSGKGIDVIHAIGFVTQASLVRLSPSQMYIFDAVLSIFGKDIVDNIFLMCTFADAECPRVLEATKVAKVPFTESFKFNNAALFTSNETSTYSKFNSMFWDMGYESFKSFFNHLLTVEARSLALTREVLSTREQLEILIPGLQEQVRVGLSELDVIEQEERTLKQHEADLMANEDFTYEVDEHKSRTIPLELNKCATICIICSFTCHKYCTLHSNSKRGCKAIDRDGNCRVCPRKCPHKGHVNADYYIEYYTESVTRTSEDLKKRYETAKTGKEKVEFMIAEANEKLSSLQEEVKSLIEEARNSIERLNEIALKPNPLTEVEYIDLLIGAEETEARPGWQARVEQYRKIRKNAEVYRKVREVSKKNAKSKSWPWKKLW